MSCSPFELRDYFLQELTDPQQRQMESHIKTCQSCQEELDRLRITEAALFSVRDEEIPQRIAFVSDKVFEPSPWRRWWASFWGSTARLGFASAAMLSAAIVVYAFHPAPAPGPRVIMAGAASPVSEAAIQQRIQAAVDQAIPGIEARYTKKTEELVNAVEQRDLRERQRIMVYATSFAERVQQEQLRDRMKPYSSSAALGEGK